MIKNPTCFAYISDASSRHDKVKKKRCSCNGKMKTKWEGRFPKKILRIQSERVVDSESNGGIFDSLASFDDEL